MFRSYALDLDEIYDLIKDENVSSISKSEEKREFDLRRILNGKDAPDAKEICNLFFPVENKYHVFLSHSGLDEQKVQKFAQWLKNNFEINSFVDSDLWGSIEKLKQEIDDAEKKANDCFSYESSMHVHIMLCHALTQMIDDTECFIFLKTSNSSISQESPENPITFSPWIFYELSLIESIRVNVRHRGSLPQKLVEKYLQDEEKSFFECDENNNESKAFPGDNDESEDVSVLVENSDKTNALFGCAENNIEANALLGNDDKSGNINEFKALFECVDNKKVKICYPIPSNMSHLKMDVLKKWFDYIQNPNSMDGKIPNWDCRAQIDFCETVSNEPETKWGKALNWLYRNFQS
ncbi:hypothetical protein IKQ19_12015 [Candidatus Saccharibacteria bacterium]|nr:hypothetical protein [Candidatus Saccharibacteria bacterium]